MFEYSQLWEELDNRAGSRQLAFYLVFHAFYLAHFFPALNRMRNEDWILIMDQVWKNFYEEITKKPNKFGIRRIKKMIVPVQVRPGIVFEKPIQIIWLNDGKCYIKPGYYWYQAKGNFVGLVSELYLIGCRQNLKALASCLDAFIRKLDPLQLLKGDKLPYDATGAIE